MKITEKLKEFFQQIKNFFFCIRYPFWTLRNVWTGKKVGHYKWTEYDNIPQGWRDAFGKQLSKDLKKQLIKDHRLFKFRFTQIKEKWGHLCLYTNGCSEELQNIIEYYEHLSMCYCIKCGKPVRYATKGYILYLCKDCIKNLNLKDKESYRVTEKDIPKVSRYDKSTDTWIPVNLGVDFYKAWDIERKENKDEEI